MRDCTVGLSGNSPRDLSALVDPLQVPPPVAVKPVLLAAAAAVLVELLRPAPAIWGGGLPAGVAVADQQSCRYMSVHPPHLPPPLLVRRSALVLNQ
jgi:hypothetical protein